MDKKSWTWFMITADGTWRATRRPRRIEGSGEPPDEAVIVEFPTVEKAEAYYNDPRYEPYRETRKAATDTTLVLVQGV